MTAPTPEQRRLRLIVIAMSLNVVAMSLVLVAAVTR